LIHSTQNRKKSLYFRSVLNKKQLFSWDLSAGRKSHTSFDDNIDLLHAALANPQKKLSLLISTETPGWVSGFLETTQHHGKKMRCDRRSGCSPKEAIPFSQHDLLPKGVHGV